MRLHLTLFKKGLILVAIPLLFQLAFIGLVAKMQQENADAQAWSSHSQDVMRETHAVLTDLVDAQCALRGFQLADDTAFTQPYISASRGLPEKLRNLPILVQDNPPQLARAERIAEKASEVLSWLAQADRLARDGAAGQASVRERTQAGQRLMDTLRQEVADFLKEEVRLEAVRAQAVEQSRRELNWSLVVGGMAAFLTAGALSLVFSRGVSGRLNTLAENARQLSRGDRLAPPVGGTDEVAALDRVLHDMAQALAGAAEKERAYAQNLERRLSEQRRAEEALRQSEETFRLVVESATDYAIIRLDPEGRVASWNPGAERIKGYRADEIIGKHFSCFYPADTVARGWPEHELRVATGEGRFEDEGWRVRKDGSRFWANVVITALRNRGGQLEGFSKLTRDLTERKQAEDTIRRMNEELELRVQRRTAELAEANRDLAQKNQENEMFVYSVSHDLRSPLVNLEGFSQELALACRDVRAILEDAGLPPAVRQRGLALVDGDMAESARFIQTAVRRLSNIIDALLRLSRAGRVEYQRQPVDLDPLVRRVVEALRATIEERGASVNVGCLPPAWGDPTALEQVFANLIGNALKYLDPGRPGRIEVGIDPNRGQSDGLQTYSVKDNGLGIPEAYQHKVFQAFQRVHPEVAPGEGMGLAIVRRIVERHEGKVWVESRPGEGSTFFVVLPAPPPEAAIP